MIFIGTDLSLTGTGVSLIDNDGDFLEDILISTGPHDFKTEEERLYYIADAVLVFIDEATGGTSGDLFINVEGISFGSRGSRLAQISGLHYLLRHFLWKAEFDYIITPPKELKKWVAGNGNAKKELMLLKTYKRWGIEFSDNDKCDAFCLAKYAKYKYERRIKPSYKLKKRSR